MSIFKFPNQLNEKGLGDDLIVWVVTEEMIQMEAESEIDRRLTDIELNRVFQCFDEDDETLWNRMVLIREAVNSALKNPREWSEFDQKYLSEKLATQNKK